jgi:hypothetical protein
MLCVKRTLDQRVIITVPPSDRPREITMTQLTDERWGFEADRDVVIDREEIHRRKQLAAASPASGEGKDKA